MSLGAWDVLNLALCLLFAAGFFYFYAFGVHFRDRALSRAAGLAFVASVVGAVVFLARVFL